MELRQLRYFVRVAELGSIGRAARDLGVVASALSQQISRLESELATRLLTRSTTGVTTTPAGAAFLRQAQLTLRHAESAVAAAREARLAGTVSIGFAPTTASLLARPFYAAMTERYPNVRLHLVEGLSGNLGDLLNARRLDLAVLFQNDSAQGRSVVPVLDERLFLLAPRGMMERPDGEPVRMADLAGLPLAVTSKAHGLRAWVEAAFERAGIEPWIGVEVDGLTTLMDLVQAHPIATIQPGAAVARVETGCSACTPSTTRISFAATRSTASATTSSRPPRWPRALCCWTPCARWSGTAAGQAPPFSIRDAPIRLGSLGGRFSRR